MMLITSWLWFRFVHTEAMAGNTKRNVAKISSGRLAKSWIKRAMEIENSILQKKIDLAKSKNKPILDSEEGFFKIPERPVERLSQANFP